MSAKPPAAAPPTKANGRGGVALVDLSLRNWIFEWRGTSAIIGKLVDEDEDSLRSEVHYTRKAPVATLCPIYIVTFTDPYRLSGEDNDTVPLTRMRQMDALIRAFMGRATHQPLNFELTGFAYLSDWPEEMRREVVRAIQDVERRSTVARIGLVEAMEAQHGG